MGCIMSLKTRKSFDEMLNCSSRFRVQKKDHGVIIRNALSQMTSEEAAKMRKKLIDAAGTEDFFTLLAYLDNLKPEN